MINNPLLSNQEYNKMKSFRAIENSETFYSLLHKASDVLMSVTKHFYTQHDFETDEESRKLAYLKALACQIEYFYETGNTTTVGLNSTPQVMDLGRTKVSMMQHVNDEGTTIPKSIICPDIYLYLEGTGLLDRSDA